MQAPELNQDQVEMLWVAATRYFLGRMTISVSSFCETLCQHWNGLPVRAQVIMQRDIDEAFERDDRARRDHEFPEWTGTNYFPLGQGCDRRAWETVRALWYPLRKEEGIR